MLARPEPGAARGLAESYAIGELAPRYAAAFADAAAHHPLTCRSRGPLAVESDRGLIDEGRSWGSRMNFGERGYI